MLLGLFKHIDGFVSNPPKGVFLKDPTRMWRHFWRVLSNLGERYTRHKEAITLKEISMKTLGQSQLVIPICIVVLISRKEGGVTCFDFVEAFVLVVSANAIYRWRKSIW